MLLSQPYQCQCSLMCWWLIMLNLELDLCLPLQWARAALQRVEMRTCLLLLCRTRRLNTHPLASLSLSKESNTTKSRRERRAQRKHTLLLKPRRLRYNNTYMHILFTWQRQQMWNAWTVTELPLLSELWHGSLNHAFMSLCLTSQISHHLCIIWW